MEIKKKKKKILVLSISAVLVALLIVFAALTGIVYSKDLTNNLNYMDNKYNENYDPSTNPVEFNVATYNVKCGDTTKENLTKINQQLKEYNLDFVGLQEIDSDDSKRSSKNKSITTLSNGFANHYFVPTESLAFGKDYGIMTMSNHNFIESDRFFLPMPGRFFMFTGEPRVCTRQVINVNGVDIAFYNCHLAYENNEKVNHTPLRIAQLQYILYRMEDDPCEYKVMMGDLNLTSFDELNVFNYESNKYLYSFVNNPDNQYVSYRGNDCTFKCLDNIIYTNNLELVTSKMVENELSDHNMIFAKFKTLDKNLANKPNHEAQE